MNDTSEIFTLHRGDSPLLVSVPHAGTDIPEELRSAYTKQAIDVEDTDWHLGEVYDFVRCLGASLLVPRISRYVIDLNRPPDNRPMYPGANNTELCPTRAFSGAPLYQDQKGPGVSQIADRLQRYWQPYHAALRAELDRLRASHGHVLLWDGHSIASRLPWLFDGNLSDLNLGSALGQSCAPELRDEVVRAMSRQTDFSYVVDGRFKGGFITRHYGRPEQGVHALQMEMTFSSYLRTEFEPFVIEPLKLSSLQCLLRDLLNICLTWKPSRA